MKEKIENHPVIQHFKEVFAKAYCDNNLLVGGAVIDIIEGREPKDYDFQGILRKGEFIKAGYEFICETATAITLKKEKTTVQLLKTIPDDFDFTIAKSSYNFRTGLLTVDEISFESKILIPCPNAFLQKKNALNSLKRVPHWKNKGYKIPDSTYLSLLNVLSKQSNFNS